jgi:tryptophanyl-tRNA synthetase
MSKSRGNAIYLTDDGATVERKVRGMYTDPNRVRADVPGQVEDNPVFVYHDGFNPDQDEVEDLKRRYRQGSWPAPSTDSSIPSVTGAPTTKHVRG